MIWFDYLYLGKKERGLIKKYLQKVTGYSRPQVTRQIREYRETGRVRVKEYKRNKFERKYSNKDIQLLALDRRITRLSQWGGPKEDLRAHGQYLWGRRILEYSEHFGIPYLQPEKDHLLSA